MESPGRVSRSWRFRMSREVVASSARMLTITCLAIAILSTVFDNSEIRLVRLLACLLVGLASLSALLLLKKRQFGGAVLILLVSLYAASAAGAIGTHTGLRAPSLLVLSMFSLICAFAFPRWLAVTCIGLNVTYLIVLLGLEKNGIIDPMGHLQALNSVSVFIVLVTLSVIFGMMGFPLGQQVDKAMRRMQDSRVHLGRSREMYRSLVEGAPLGIVNFDAAGQITSVNPMLVDWLGRDANAWRGMPLSVLLHRKLPEDFSLPGARALRFDVSVGGGEQQRWFSVTVSPFPHGQGAYRGGVALLLDETDRKRSELELIQAKEAAEAAAVAKTRFLSHMSHELRTPMAGIIGSIGLAQDDRVTPERRKRMLTVLDTSARTMLRLLDDILDVCRIGEGRLKIVPAVFQPHALVSEALELFRPAVHERGLSLDLEWAGDPETFARADPLRIRQVLNIFLDNAIRFTDSGSITVMARVYDSPSAEIRLAISVRDTGIGLTEAHQAQMFRPFTELGLKRPENQRGAGLGLSIAKGLVSLMGGDIGVNSRAGVGSDFWFEVPMEAVQATWLGTNESDSIAAL